MANKRNMTMETIAVLFLVSRSDVSQPRRTTSEANEHTYGNWRQFLREFTIEQLIRIVDKQQLKMNAIFESNLAVSRDKGGKGYQQTMPEFIKSLKLASSKRPPTGPVEVDLNESAVTQLWSEVSSVIRQVNRIMKPFLKLFGVEDGNGLSPFAADIDDPNQLSSLLKDLFKPPKRDPRDKAPVTSNSLPSNPNDGADCEDDDGEEEEDEDEDALEEASQSDFVPCFVEDINTTPDADEEESESVDGAESNVMSDQEEGIIESFFDDGATSIAYLELKGMLGCTNIGSIAPYAVKIMELLQIGKIEKGSLQPEGKFQSIVGRWFKCKPKTRVGSGNAETEIREGDSQYINRDSLVSMKCKRGKNVSIQLYRVLAIFSKHYNKWFTHWDSDTILFEKDSKKFKILARMVERDGVTIKEVELKKGGDWGPKFVFCMRLMCDIHRIESDLVSDEW